MAQTPACHLAQTFSTVDDSIMPNNQYQPTVSQSPHVVLIDDVLLPSNSDFASTRLIETLL